MKPGADDSARRISRRDLLRSAATMAGSLLIGSRVGIPEAAFAEGSLEGSESFGMLTDLTRCIGCRRCEEACNKANDLPPPEVPFDDFSVFEEERRTDAQTYTVVNRYSDPLRLGEPAYNKVQCMHCEEPACASACLVAALKKTPAGPVVYDQNLCIGCRYCMAACPFSIPTYEYSSAFSPKIGKCFMCYDVRITEGEIPACAAECPMEAITFGKRSELLKLARDRISSESHEYVDHIYGEYEVGGTDWLYISGVPFGLLGFPMDLVTTPFPELTRGFLSMVPLVLVAWPALLGGIYLMSSQREQTAETVVTESEKGDDQP